MAIHKLKELYYYCTMKHADYEVKMLYMLQDTESGFNRLDMIVRYLAIEEYYGKNNFGFQLYRKMQGKRINLSYVDESEEKFRKLILSWETKGYDKQSGISLDSRLLLIDGSHRMALALYHGYNKISCKIYKRKVNYLYGVDWFVENGFTNDEIEKILSKEKEIRKMLISEC